MRLGKCIQGMQLSTRTGMRSLHFPVSLLCIRACRSRLEGEEQCLGEEEVIFRRTEIGRILVSLVRFREIIQVKKMIDWNSMNDALYIDFSTVECVFVGKLGHR